MKIKVYPLIRPVLRGMAIMSILLGILLAGLPASAQEPGWNLAYSEYFGGDAPGLTLDVIDSENYWSLDDGVLHGRGYAGSRYDPGWWQDGELRFQVFVNGFLATRFRWGDDQWYALYLERADDYSIVYRLVKYYGNEEFSEDLLADTYYIGYDSNLQVSILMNGGAIRVRLERDSVEGSPPAPLVGEYFDPQPLGFGTFGFDIQSGEAYIDNIEFWVPPQEIFISGRVFEGAFGDTGQALPGVSVSLYGAYSPHPELGKYLNSAVSDGEGYYAILVPPEKNFYYYFNIIASEPGGFLSEGAQSPNGQLIEPAWIQYYGPLYSDYPYYDNNFWFWRIPTETPTPTLTSTRTPTCTTTCTPRPSDTPTRRPSNTPTRRPSATPTRRPSDTPRPAIPVTPTPPDGEGLDPALVIGGLAAIGAAGAAGGYLLVRGLRKPPAPQSPQKPPEQPPDQPKKPDQPPLLPLIPPLRLVRVWLSENEGSVIRPLNDRRSLKAGAAYNLHVQITPRGAPPEQQEVSSAAGLRKLSVVTFSPQEDFELEQPTASVDLPQHGESSELRQVVRPQQTGRRKLRVNVYYGNVLLQSALIEADVAQQGSAAGERITRQIDYVANPDLNGLVGMRQPNLNIFTNQVSDGTHWIGVFGQGHAGEGPRSHMLTFGAAELAARARAARELLLEIEGAQSYRFSALLPLDQLKLGRLEKALVRLAVHGWELFHNLFIGSESGADEEWLAAVRQALFRPGGISVARCRGDNPGLPWAAIYSLRLLPSRQSEIHLCEEFKRQLSANLWSAEGRLLEKHDLLDDPPACHALAACPLKGSQRLLTVCPFGFWGLMHQIEQPIQLVTPTPVDQIPPELKDRQGKPDPETHRQSLYIPHGGQQALDLAIGVFQDIPGAAEHAAEISAFAHTQTYESVVTPSAEQMRLYLENGSQELIYFYCHGEEHGGEFKLKLGSSSQPSFLGAADLDPLEAARPRSLHALAILNGCKTLAVAPERMHGFLATLRKLGFSGVVGSEVPVYPPLARPFGNQLLQRLLAGQSIGEAFLGLRRELQRQGNPLGMIYTYYAPSGLHLHNEAGCAFCQAHPPDQKPS